MLTDKYKFGFTVAVFFIPMFFNIRILFKVFLLLALRECSKPFAVFCSGNLYACLLKYIEVISLVFIGEPKNTLCTNNALWPIVYKFL